MNLTLRLLESLARICCGAAAVAAGEAGVGVVFITHNPHHAFLIGDQFTVLSLGHVSLSARRGEITVEHLIREMADPKESLDDDPCLDLMRLLLPELRAKILANFGVGFNHIDTNAAKARGLVVTNTPDVLTKDVADLGVAMMLAQAPWRLGFSTEQLRPLDAIRALQAPLFVASGVEDRHTPWPETQALFAAAAGPKTLMPVAGAAHVDLHAFDARAYEARLGPWLHCALRRATLKSSG